MSHGWLGAARRPFLTASVIVIVAAAVDRPGFDAASAPQSALDGRVAAHINQHAADHVAFRRDLHQYPELSGEERRTAAKIAERLAAIGLDVRTGVGGHGVVGLLKGGRPGPLVAYRADMDAVRSIEHDPVAFRSLTAGVRHICGHDVHMAIGVAIAAALAAVRDDVAGSVLFVFQPSEERATGAQAMLAAGVFDAGRPAAIFGVHTSPLEVGTLGVKPGAMMAARDRLRVTLTGTGDLQAAGDAARRVLDGAATLRLDQAFTPSADPFSLVQSGPLVRGAAGTATITSQATVAGAAARDRVRKTVADGLAAIAVPDVRITHEYEPAALAAGVTNDPDATATAMAAIRRVAGDRAVVALSTIPPAFSEDFGVFQAQVPGTFFFLGVGNAAKGIAGVPHTPEYVADEDAIAFGARAMAAVLLDALGRRGG